MKFKDWRNRKYKEFVNSEYEKHIRVKDWRLKQECDKNMAHEMVSRAWDKRLENGYACVADFGTAKVVLSINGDEGSGFKAHILIVNASKSRIKEITRLFSSAINTHGGLTSVGFTFKKEREK